MKKKFIDALKELEENHQHALIDEIRKRNAQNLDFTAIFYRGTKISYRQFFDTVDTYANVLYQLGYRKGDEVPVCTLMLPEFIYLFLAVGKIGAVIHILSPWTSENVTADILKKTKSRHFFVSSNFYKQVENAVQVSGIREVFLMRLSDSLTDAYSQYAEMDYNFLNFHEEPETSPDITVRSMKEFAALENKSVPLPHIPVSLDDFFSISYTSGTTEKGEAPKGMIHNVRSYMVLSRFMDNDLSGYGEYHNLVALANLPPNVHTALTTSIITPFFERFTIAVEPCYDPAFFYNALLINHPNFAYNGCSFWRTVCRELEKPKNKDVKFPELILAVVTGEGMGKGEEYYFNRIAKEHDFGSDVLPFPLTHTRFSVGGGTNEASGILVTLFRKLQALRPYYLFTGKKVGLMPIGCCKARVLDVTTGKECSCGDVGRVQLCSPCSMNRYTNYEELNKKAMERDSNGDLWIDTGDYGSVDRIGRINLRGRLLDHVILQDGSEYPLYHILEEVEKKYKTILTCMVVVSEGNIVVHYEPQFATRKSIREVSEIVGNSVLKVLPEELRHRTYLRYHDNAESFQYASSGKRDRKTLIAEGIRKAVSLC